MPLKRWPKPTIHHDQARNNANTGEEQLDLFRKNENPYRDIRRILDGIARLRQRKPPTEHLAGDRPTTNDGDRTKIDEEITDPRTDLGYPRR